MSPRAKAAALAVLLVVCVGAPIAYVARSMRANVAGEAAPSAAATASPASAPARSAGSTAPPARSLPPGPRALFRYTGLGEDHGRLVQTTLDGPEPSVRVPTPLHCERVHFARGSGVCLTAERGALTTYAAVLFDSEFRVRRSFPLGGSPSRARVSSDGRYAAFTLFESGHSYAAANFSTRTSVVEAATGEPALADLERLSVSRNGARFHAVDFNFWGVTFARKSSRFYATLESAKEIHLVEGSVEGRSAKVVRQGVECPSLSPDNRRIAFKRRTGGRAGERVAAWRVAVLNLASGAVTELAETRSVDDQVDWLDDDRILYSLPEAGSAAMNTWVVPADGSGAPALFMKYADSLVVVRD